MHKREFHLKMYLLRPQERGSFNPDLNWEGGGTGGFSFLMAQEKIFLIPHEV
jgi:hypothetical protein